VRERWVVLRPVPDLLDNWSRSAAVVVTLTSMTTTTSALLDPMTGLPVPGRWTVDAARLELTTTFRGLFGLRGRFTEAVGYLDIGGRLPDAHRRGGLVAHHGTCRARCGADGSGAGRSRPHP